MGQLIAYKNEILNSRFDVDNSYADGYYNDNNYYSYGETESSVILTNYLHNSPLFYGPVGTYNTFANRTFHSIDEPYTTLLYGHALQRRLLKMFGVGSKLGRGADNIVPYLATISRRYDFATISNTEGWVKYGVEQLVAIPSWANKVTYGVKYLVKSNDVLADHNFAGLKLNFRKLYSSRSYVNVHLVRNTSVYVDLLQGLYFNSPNGYNYFNANWGANAMSQWVGPQNSRVKVRMRSSTTATTVTDKFVTIFDTIDIPTFSGSYAEPDWGDGRPEHVSLEMFYAELLNYLTGSPYNSGSIYFYEPFLYFR